MKLKISNTQFYKRHNYEIQKYLNYSNVLHIINLNSKDKITEDISNKIYVDPQNIFKDNNLSDTQKFNVIILTDVLESTNDLGDLFLELNNLLLPGGKLIISSINTKWILLVKLLEFLKIKQNSNKLSYIHINKISTIAKISNFEFIRSYTRQFLPFSFFYLGNLINKVFETLFFYLNIGIKTYVILRKVEEVESKKTKTIIIPAKNEEGNLLELFNRIPNKEDFEIIFSCGISNDRTIEVCKQIIHKNENLDIKFHLQSKKGKANAVWESINKTQGELIAILDSDLSVDPEIIPSFFEVLEKNQADFVNGSRLVYEMEKGSMRFINLIGNRVFQNLISLMIKQAITDTLCGTKVFKRELLKNIDWWRENFNLFDPFGDFDLLFTAAFFSEKIVEIPVHYKARTYGVTQISRFRDGFKLIKYFSKSFFAFNSSTIR